MRRPLLVLALLALAAPAAAQAPLGASPDSALLASAEASRTKGAESAPVTIIEVSDFQCPYCREFATTTLAALDSAYLRTGKAKLVYLNFPIPGHRQAWAAAEAALCAGVQGKFWPMHDRLFAEQTGWSGKEDAVARFEAYAGALGLEMDAYRSCTRDDRVASILVGDVMQIAGAGVSGTPTFVINGEKVLQGAQPFEEFRKAIDEALAKK